MDCDVKMEASEKPWDSELQEPDIIIKTKDAKVVLEPSNHDLIQENIEGLPFPWNVDSLEDYLKYCCPECDLKSQSRDLFMNHVLLNHEQVNNHYGHLPGVPKKWFYLNGYNFFVKSTMKKWLVPRFKGFSCTFVYRLIWS